MAKTPPTRDQMDPTQIKGDLARETFTAPEFVYPAALAGAATVCAVTLGVGLPGTIAAGAATGFALFAGGFAAIQQFLRRDDRLYHRMIELQERMAREVEQRREQLRDRLDANRDHDALGQLDNLSRKLELLTGTLRDRFDPAEITFVRYLGTAEQVYLGALDNLRRVAEMKDALGSIDVRKLERQHRKSIDEGQPQQARHIKDRIDIGQTYEATIRQLIESNEEAITRLSQVHQALINLDTGTGFTRAPLESAMAELQRLAQRTSEYGQS